MRQIIIVLSILAACTKGHAQTGREKQLLALEEKYFAATGEKEKAMLCREKLLCYIHAGNYAHEAVNDLKRIDYRLLPDSLQQDFLWNAALFSCLAKEPRYAMNYVARYKELSGDTSANYYLLELFAFSDFDTARVTQIVKQLSLKSADFNCLDCMNKVAAYGPKHMKAYVTASAIVPGSGSMLNGNVLKGASSLLFNAATGYMIYRLLSNRLYINAVGWGLGLGLKFYTGNIRLTQKLVNEKALKKKNKLAADCELKFSEVLRRYPLEFR